MIYITPEELIRFWDKVDILGPEDCWNWKASTRGWDGRKKYGQFARSRTHRKKGEPYIFYSHRLAWMVARGFPINYLSDEQAVMHDCDNPLCCNPAHLTLGTQLQNIRDMVQKGRHRNRFTGPIVPEPQEIPI